MFNVGGGELIVILLIALIVLGPQRLPDAARQIGKTMGDLRRLSTGFQNEVRSALDTADDPTRVAARRNVLAKEEPVSSSDGAAPVRTEPLVAGPGLEPRNQAEPPAPAKKAAAKRSSPAKRASTKNGTPVKKTAKSTAATKKAAGAKRTAKAAPRRSES